MKKSVKRIFSSITALLLCMCILAPSTAAFQEEDTSEPVVLTGESAVSENIMEYLLEKGITVNEETTFQLAAPAETSRRTRANVKNALIVTNEDEESHVVTKDLIALYNEDGPVAYEAPVENGARISTPMDFPAYGADYYIVHAVATYDGYKLYPYYGAYHYVRPLSLKFDYTKLQNCTVSQITVQYIADGQEYNYPALTSTGNSARWVIEISQSNPVAGRQYSKTQNYPSDKVIYLMGGPLVGDALYFSVTADGKEEHEIYNINDI